MGSRGRTSHCQSPQSLMRCITYEQEKCLLHESSLLQTNIWKEPSWISRVVLSMFIRHVAVIWGVRIQLHNIKTDNFEKNITTELYSLLRSRDHCIRWVDDLLVVRMSVKSVKVSVGWELPDMTTPILQQKKLTTSMSFNLLLIVCRRRFRSIES